MEHLLCGREFGLLTTVYRNLFSYIVERGYWMFTEAWCERMVDQPLSRGDRADWLIWWCWIKFYLRQDYVLAARLAESALEQKPRQNRPRFEGHRRALVAYGRTGNADGVRRHQAGAAEICRRAWPRTSNESIDLLNSEASAYLALGTRLRDSHAIDHAMQLYRDAEQAAIRRVEPDTRAIGIAVLGQASCLAARGKRDAEALQFAQNALEYAWKVSWLRGIVEASELVAVLADRLGRPDLARSARDVAARMGSRLRSPQPAGAGGAEHV
jgi:tetratricopeptide (TPR) repeat protein